MKQPKCPNCGSENVELRTDLEDFPFWIDENGRIDFEVSDIRDKLNYCLEFRDVKGHCYDCHEDWYYKTT